MLSHLQPRNSRQATVNPFPPCLDRGDYSPQRDPVTDPLFTHQKLRILSVGEDRLLLYSRRLILETAGYVVESVRADVAIEQALLREFDLVLLCHTIPEEVVTHIVDASARIAPQTLLLQVSPLDNPFRNKAHPMLISAEPVALLGAVAGLFANQPKSSSKPWPATG